MRCAQCQTDNPAGNRFCEQCETPLEARCSQCNTPVRPGARFCGVCGHRLVEPETQSQPSVSQPLNTSSPAGTDYHSRLVSYTPEHLTEKVLTSRSVLFGVPIAHIVEGWRLQGQAYCAQGRLAEAEAVLQKALALAKEVGNPPQLWKTAQAICELYEKQGHTDRAQSAYASTLEVTDGVASRLQDQEIKRTFLEAKPVQEIQNKIVSSQ